MPATRPVVAIALALLVVATGTAHAAPYDLDATFGSGGGVTTLAGTDAQARAAVLQPDGRIVIAGSGSGAFLLQRFDADGTLDSGFGSGGTVTTAIGGTSAANALVLQPDGTLVAAGVSTTSGTAALALARYLPDGTLDPTFGTGGIVTTSLGDPSRANALVRQTDGKLVAGGTIGGVGALVRYENDGTIDGLFGSAGVVQEAGIGAVNGLALQADESIIVCMRSSGDAFVVGRYDTAGVPDPTFAGAGFATPSTDGTLCHAVTVQADGKIVAVGEDLGTHAYPIGVIVRLATDGTLDPSMPSNAPGTVPDGVRIWMGPGPFGYFRPRAVLVDPAGRILAAGQYQTTVTMAGFPHATQYLRLDRMTSDGVGDPTFPPVAPFAGPPSRSAESVLLQPDGKIVIAGFANGVALARFVGVACGNGIIEGTEPCDDGNAIEGDGCDTNCTVTACGNGIVTAGEDCDRGPASDDCCSPTCTFDASGSACLADANGCTDDVCNATGTCTHPANTAACDDGLACTVADTCAGGACVGAPAVTCDPCEACDEATVTCVPTPRSICSATISGAARLTAKDSAVNTKDQIEWQWARGSTLPANFGDPTTTDDYTLCVYDQSPAPALLFRARVPAGGLCGTQACWRPNSKGFRYKDKERSPDGVQSLGLAAGAGNAKIQLKASGASLTRPDGFPVLPFPGAVRVQLQRDGGGCWGATFSAPTKNDGAQYKAKSD